MLFEATEFSLTQLIHDVLARCGEDAQCARFWQHCQDDVQCSSKTMNVPGFLARQSTFAGLDRLVKAGITMIEYCANGDIKISANKQHDNTLGWI